MSCDCHMFENLFLLDLRLNVMILNTRTKIRYVNKSKYFRVNIISVEESG